MAAKRDSKGRWLKESGSPNPDGRLKKTEKEALAAAREAVLGILHSEISADDWRAIVQKQVSQAKAGSWRSVQWLSSYVLGAPPDLNEQPAQKNLVVLNFGNSDDFKVGELP